MDRVWLYVCDRRHTHQVKPELIELIDDDGMAEIESQMKSLTLRNPGLPSDQGLMLRAGVPVIIAVKNKTCPNKIAEVGPEVRPEEVAKSSTAAEKIQDTSINVPVEQWEMRSPAQTSQGLLEVTVGAEGRVVRPPPGLQLPTNIQVEQPINVPTCLLTEQLPILKNAEERVMDMLRNCAVAGENQQSAEVVESEEEESIFQIPTSEEDRERLGRLRWSHRQQEAVSRIEDKWDKVHAELKKLYGKNVPANYSILTLELHGPATTYGAPNGQFFLDIIRRTVPVAEIQYFDRTEKQWRVINAIVDLASEKSFVSRSTVNGSLGRMCNLTAEEEIKVHWCRDAPFKSSQVAEVRCRTETRTGTKSGPSTYTEFEIRFNVVEDSPIPYAVIGFDKLKTGRMLASNDGRYLFFCKYKFDPALMHRLPVTEWLRLDMQIGRHRYPFELSVQADIAGKLYAHSRRTDDWVLREPEQWADHSMYSCEEARYPDWGKPPTILADWSKLNPGAVRLPKPRDRVTNRR